MNSVLLIDVDSKIPNLALMKLSTYYKSKGNSVTLQRLKLPAYPHERLATVPADRYDQVFVSSIFNRNKKRVTVVGCNDVVRGGTGHDLITMLPSEIDSREEDYSIYPENDISYGFISRGCPRTCSFCFVPKKEGKLHFYRSIDKIIKHRKVSFMDNNFLAYDDHIKTLKELNKREIYYQFNQGLDIRLVREENIKLISEGRYFGNIIFAFDHVRYKKLITDKLILIRKHITQDWRLKFFILVGYDSSLEDDVERIEFCKQYQILPYIMRHENCYTSDNANFYTDIASWCNQPALFKKMSFGEFLNKRHRSTERIDQSMKGYNK